MTRTSQSKHRYEREALHTYRDCRRRGQRPGTAYLSALHAFVSRHPEVTAFYAMSVLKDALSAEPELGLVDSGAAQAARLRTT